MKEIPEIKQYKADKKELRSYRKRFLKGKITFGGKVGSASFKKLIERDFEMNKHLYIEAKREQDMLRKKKLFSCPCGNKKAAKFKICYQCFMKKKNEITNLQ